MLTLDQADKIIHPVEVQWHYPIMILHGWQAVNKTGTGFVRSYIYEHPEVKNRIKVNTGFHGDYWIDLVTGKGGYHGTLEQRLKGLG